MTLRIVSNFFVAGAVMHDDVVVRCAGIINYMRGWRTARVKRYAESRGWTVEEI